MGVDDPTQQNSSSGGGCGGGGGGGGSDDGKSSKKLKQKKVPQRGLGVAQLEKIRLEEQEKDSVIQHVHSNKNNIINNNNSPSMSVIQASRQNHPFPSSINSLYRQQQQQQPSSSIPTNLDCLNTSAAATVPLPKPISSNVAAAGEIGWRPGHGFGPGIWPGLWNDETNLEMDRHNNNNNSMPIHHSNTTTNLPLETIWPSSASLMQRTHQLLLQQSRPSSSSMVKIPSYGISSSSPAMNFNHHYHHPMEPPSNQSFYGSSTNDYTSFWPEEDNKIVGMKRPYPFSIDNPTGPPSFRIRYPPPPPPPPPLTLPLPLPLPPFVGAITRSDESAAALPNLDLSNLVFRDRHSSAFHDMRKQFQAGRVENGDFLSLAPPSTTNHIRDTPPEMEYLPCQGGGGGEELGSGQRQPFYSFFPSATKAPSDDPSGNMHEGGGSSSSSGGGGDGGGAEKKNVDLNLKL